MSAPKKLVAKTLGLVELAPLEDCFLLSFEEAVEKGVPEDAAGLKTCAMTSSLS